jgi:hypothetical protein
VLTLVRRLPDTSLTFALARGGPEHLGWGHDRHLMADLFDAVNQNTRASGNFKKPPKFKPYPRPKPKAEKKPRSVADVYNSLRRG